VTLGTDLTASDYLGIRKGTDVWYREGNIIKRRNPPQLKGFGGVLSSCLEGRDAIGLTAADYLANPVSVNTVAKKICLEGSPERMTSEIAPFHDRPIDAESLLNVPKQGADKSEASRSNSVMEDIEHSINKAAQAYNLPPDLIRGVIKAESDFQVKAESKAGARGLMQLMPATAEELGVKDPYDIDQNVDGGTRYLKRMMDRFGSDLKKALAAYNAGPGTVERYNGRVPPYQETRQYVKRVLEFSGLEA
jgi:hypothetical protein